VTADDRKLGGPTPVMPEAMRSADAEEVRRVFRPSRANLVAGIILGVLSLLAGIAMAIGIWQAFRDAKGVLPLWAAEPGGLSLTSLPVYVAITIGFGVCAAGLIRWSLSRFSFRIFVSDRGIEVRDSSMGYVIGWDDIKTAMEVREFTMPPAFRWPVRNPDWWISSRLYVLGDEQGDLLSFDANTVRDHVALGAMIKEATVRHGIPWTVVEQQRE
jgi:hypothetical protein